MIPLARPDITDEDIQRAVGVFRSGALVQGENVSAFEDDLGGFMGLPHVSVVSSGTAALHLTLMALGIGPEDKVLVPAFTFPATANVVEVLGARVCLCDVEPHSYVVSPDKIKSAVDEHISKGLKAIMVVHEFGAPAEMGRISGIARSAGLRLIEDAACALGTVADGKHAGWYGDAACFSFHPRKAITTGEGGAVATKDQGVYDKVCTLRNHGMVRSPEGLRFLEAGLNYRMTDFQAALALGQLQRFKEELKKRQRLVEIYISELSGNQAIILPDLLKGHSWQTFMVVLDDFVDRDSIIKKMLERGVQTNLGAQAINCLDYYSAKYGFKPEDCPVATGLYRHGLALPLYGSLSEEDVMMISRHLKAVL